MEWFRHDMNAHDDIKIKKLLKALGYAGLGAYWYLMELMYCNGGRIAFVDAIDELSLFADDPETTPAEYLKEFTDLDLVFIEDAKICSNRVDAEIMLSEKNRISKSEAGKKGMASRWGKRDNAVITDDNRPYQRITQNRTEQNKNNNIALSSDNAHSPAVAEETAKSAKNPVNYNEIMSLFNRICTGFPQISKMSDRRRKAIKARINAGYSIRDFETVFEKAQASDFLKGANDRNWSADFDWMIADSNMAKILDGNYDNGKASMKATKPSMFSSGIAADGSDPEKFKNNKTIAELMREQEAKRAAR
ncbi:MAG: DUF4373 domain-containing protein [Oscillospiraceae bacterium]|nr:DUF4373 domain-containing protein [Oscillospiraceae bacterium]